MRTGLVEMVMMIDYGDEGDDTMMMMARMMR